MTVYELIEMLTDAISSNSEFGEKEITIVGEESGDTVSFAGYYEVGDSIHLCSEECEDLDDD